MKRPALQNKRVEFYKWLFGTFEKQGPGPVVQRVDSTNEQDTALLAW